MLELVGYPYSPYVRKVLVVLEHKGLPYRLDPLDPFTETERLRPLNPAGTVPVLVADGTPVPDSAAICAWLEAYRPEPAVYPADPERREATDALVRWADEELVLTFGGSLFFQRVVKPFLLGRESHEARVAACLAGDYRYVRCAGCRSVYQSPRVVEEDLHLCYPGGYYTHSKDTGEAPEALRRLEATAPESGYLAGGFGLADIAVASWFRAGLLSGLAIREETSPRAFAYLRRVFAVPAYRAVLVAEDALDVIREAKARYAADGGLLA